LERAPLVGLQLVVTKRPIVDSTDGTADLALRLVDHIERETFLEAADRCLNAREIDALLSMMSDAIEWPDLANNAVLSDKASIHRYWTAQFEVADPSVQPSAFEHVADDVVVSVRQHVNGVRGEVIVPPAVVFHRYSSSRELISRMVSSSDEPTATS
jgi:hypothetical protein